MDVSEYEAIIEREVRRALGLRDDEPLPPPGPTAIAIGLVREREEPVIDEVKRRTSVYRDAFEEVMRLAQSATDGYERVEFVCRDPAAH